MIVFQEATADIRDRKGRYFRQSHAPTFRGQRCIGLGVPVQAKGCQDRRRGSDLDGRGGRPCSKGLERHGEGRLATGGEVFTCKRGELEGARTFEIEKSRLCDQAVSGTCVAQFNSLGLGSADDDLIPSQACFGQLEATKARLFFDTDPSLARL